MTFDPSQVDTSGMTPTGGFSSVCDIARELKHKIKGLADKLNQCERETVLRILDYIKIEEKGTDCIVQIVNPIGAPEQDQEAYSLTQNLNDLKIGKATYRKKGHDSDGSYHKSGTVDPEVGLTQEIYKLFRVYGFLLDKKSIQYVSAHVLDDGP